MADFGGDSPNFGGGFAQDNNEGVPRKKARWPWFLGGAVLLLLPCLACCLMPFGMGGALFAGLRTSEPAQEGIARALADDRVVDALGAPIEAGWFVSGDINTNPGGGEANLRIPLNGKKQAGVLYVSARKVAGSWRYDTLEVELSGDSRHINLLEEAEGAGEAGLQLEDREGNGTCERVQRCCEAYVTAVGAGVNAESACAGVQAAVNSGAEAPCNQMIQGWRQALQVTGHAIPPACE